MDKSRQLLLNLYKRYRLARKQYNKILQQCGKGNEAESMYFGYKVEAWNSLQVAKQIYYGENDE